MMLDVRRIQELVSEQGHIRGVINIPLDVSSSPLVELVEYEERPIALIC